MLPMMVLTSAKSRLIRPGMTIRSEMLHTACLSTSSTSAKAPVNEVCLPTKLRSFWLGMMIKVSTDSFSSFIPVSACAMRFLPSKAKGLVTTPTVSAPTSRAILEMMGAAPVPVPPPMPAVMNTMSAPSSISRMWSSLSSAALRPVSGLDPAPRPLVSVTPIWIFSGHSEFSSD